LNGDVLGSLLTESDGQRVLDMLARYDTLQEVSLIINNEGCLQYFKGEIPPFRNLSKLELLGMNQESDGQHGRDREVATILTFCPHIRELALSTLGWATEDDIKLLPKLVQHYRSETNERLQLKSLRLGYGFLPVQSPLAYLVELTDTALLENIRLDNDNVGISSIVLDCPIDPKQFASAKNVNSLTAERLSSDIVELIRQLNLSGRLTTLSLPRYCDSQPRARMDEDNEYYYSDWYGEDTEGPPEWAQGQMFSEPLEQAGTHWKNILIGDMIQTETLDERMLYCIATYSHLEVLTLPLPQESWPRFRDEIMPELRHLQQLFLVGSKNAGTYGYQGFKLDDDQIFAKDQPEIDELVKQRDEEYINHLTTFAREIFHANRSKIAKGDDYALLKYLGFGSFVFTCMLLPDTTSCGLAPFSVDKDGETWRYQIVLLNSDEAAAFSSIREYNEEIAELRVGGDERGPAW
jgi:hypothetical protein